ncbi:MAG: hypothetical protein PHE73_03810 [Sulfurovaceae bacterium]|nr:hypothetical protein [Sulfurovaceae bacterium]
MSEKRNIEIKIRLSEEENEKLDELAEKFKIPKARMIRNIVLGEIKDVNMLLNIGLIPIIQNASSFWKKNNE